MAAMANTRSFFRAQGSGLLAPMSVWGSPWGQTGVNPSASSRRGSGRPHWGLHRVRGERHRVSTIRWASEGVGSLESPSEVCAGWGSPTMRVSSSRETSLQPKARGLTTTFSPGAAPVAIRTPVARPCYHGRALPPGFLSEGGSTGGDPRSGCPPMLPWGGLPLVRISILQSPVSGVGDPIRSRGGDPLCPSPRSNPPPARPSTCLGCAPQPLSATGQLP